MSWIPSGSRSGFSTYMWDPPQQIQSGLGSVWNRFQSQPTSWGNPAPTSAGRTYRQGVRGLQAWGRTAAHAKGMEWLKYDLGIHKSVQGPGAISIARNIYKRGRVSSGAWQSMGKFAGRWLGRGFIGLSAYHGYQEGGIAGAVVETGKHLASTYAMGAVIGALGGVGTIAGVGAALGGGLAAGYFGTGGTGAPFVRPWTRDFARRHSALELGTPVVDNFGTVATMRQRSLQAIQNSKLSGRSALGNEAALLWTPYHY